MKYGNSGATGVGYSMPEVINNGCNEGLSVDPNVEMAQDARDTLHSISSLLGTVNRGARSPRKANRSVVSLTVLVLSNSSRVPEESCCLGESPLLTCSRLNDGRGSCCCSCNHLTIRP